MKLQFILSAAVLAASPVLAQSVGRSYSKSYGNSYLGGSIYARAYAAYSGSVTNARVTAYLDGRATASFLRQNRELGRIYVGANGLSYGLRTFGSARAFVRIAGRTVYSRSYSSSVRRSWTFSTRPVNYRVFPTDPSYRFSIGPIPMKVSGNIGAAARASVTATVASSLTNLASLRGSAQAWGWGRANVRAGIRVLGLGLTLSARFANQTLSTSTYVGVGGPRGYVRYVLQPISITLTAWARILFFRGSRTLVNWSSRVYSTYLWRR